MYIIQLCERQIYYISHMVKGKNVKLSLCLTEHQVMKAYWVSGGIAPIIL
jgi:hypothetical protein